MLTLVLFLIMNRKFDQVIVFLRQNRGDSLEACDAGLIYAG